MKNNLLEIKDLLLTLEEEREEGKSVVFTNGIFDLLHAGHLEYLEKAKLMGDLLVIGVNSDSSTKAIKGENRPVNNERDRSALLGGLRCVDYVVIFSEETPLKILEQIKPDILVKGADYLREGVVGGDFVESYGGSVSLIPLKEGISTTSLIEKLSMIS